MRYSGTALALFRSWPPGGTVLVRPSCFLLSLLYLYIHLSDHYFGYRDCDFLPVFFVLEHAVYVLGRYFV